MSRIRTFLPHTVNRTRGTPYTGISCGNTSMTGMGKTGAWIPYNCAIVRASMTFPRDC